MSRQKERMAGVLGRKMRTNVWMREVKVKKRGEKWD